MFKVSGKTGTAQISQGEGGYKSGTVNYLLSFAGYFPSDNPQYTCIVCIQKSGLPASGGGMSGVVFHKIAEGVMAKNLKRVASDARDSASIMIPDVKCGNILAADYVLSNLGIKTNTDWDGSYEDGNPIWGTSSSNRSFVVLRRKHTAKNIVPDVTGMGARDAVYQFEIRGMKVSVSGCGKVTSQSISAGSRVIKGTKCHLTLE